MWWASAISAGLSLFGAGESKEAGRQARRIGGMNADAQRAETGEELRRMGKQHRFTEGAARATAAASGFSQRKGDSQASYISSMISEHARQREWTRKSGESKAKILEQGGELAYQQSKAEATGLFGQALGQAGDAWALWKGI